MKTLFKLSLFVCLFAAGVETKINAYKMCGQCNWGQQCKECNYQEINNGECTHVNPDTGQSGYNCKPGCADHDDCKKTRGRPKGAEHKEVCVNKKCEVCTGEAKDQITCTAGGAEIPCSKRCKDLYDTQNGVVAKSGQVLCANYQCVCPEGTQYDEVKKECTGCLDDSACPTNYTCDKGHVCRKKCTSDSDCDRQTEWCSDNLCIPIPPKD